MALTEEVRTTARPWVMRNPWATLAQRWDWLLVAAIVINAAGYVGWLIVMHLRSVGWAPGQVLDRFPGYWSWFYQTFFSAEEVFAVRRSGLAARHPLLHGAAWIMVAMGYGLLLMRLRATQALGLRGLLLVALVFSVPLLVTPNLLSGDVYSYISFGRIATIYGANPFIDPPAAFPTDPYFRWVSWTTVPSVYGPGWIYPSMIITLLVEAIAPHVITYVLAYKLLALALHLVNGALIWRILGDWRTAQQGWGTALYLLNPLALIEFAGNGHNDVLMITLMLLAVLAHLRGNWLLVIAALTLASLTKWIALPLLPLYGLLLLWQSRNWQDRAIYTTSSLLVFLGLSIALYAPYWEWHGGWKNPAGRYTLRILVDAPPQKRVINSLGELAAGEYGRLMWKLGKWPNPALVDLVPQGTRGNVVIGDNTGDEDSWQARQQARYSRYIREQTRVRETLLANQKVVQNRIRTGALAVLVLTCVVGAALTRTLRTMLLASAWILFCYIALAAVWVWPWYATWFVALAALLDWRVTGRTAVLLSVLALLTYPLFPIMPEPRLIERYRAAIIYGLPLVFALWQGSKVARQLWRREISLFEERALS